MSSLRISSIWEVRLWLYNQACKVWIEQNHQSPGITTKEQQKQIQSGLKEAREYYVEDKSWKKRPKLLWS